MTECPVVIPEVLHEAARIFLGELKGHEAFFRTITSPEDLVKSANAIAERFHLIKGGAGFLKLHALKNMASEGEKLFRKKDLDVNAAILKLAEAVPVIEGEISRLDDTLLSS